MSDQNTRRGKIKQIDQTQTFASGFSKREFVLTTDEKYPQDLKFAVVKEHCSGLDQFEVGEQVTVLFNIRGNEYQGRHYVELMAWKVAASSQGQAPSEDVSQQPAAVEGSNADEDLPF